MEIFWFCMLTWVLATYVVLDGFDLGAGILTPFVAKNAEDREQVFHAIGPVWDGNEVWLLVTGGTMFVAFPKLLATAFSGFYLPLMMVLWLLVFRALGIELRHYLTDSVWIRLWTGAFFIASLLLSLFLGAALGNVVRGVPLDNSGTFFEPLWTNFRLGDQTGILDWYTILIGITAGCILTLHGALWLLHRTQGSVQERAKKISQRLFPFVFLWLIISSVASFWVNPQIKQNLVQYPWGLSLVALALAALVGIRFFLAKSQYQRAFLSSAVLLYSMMGLTALGVYPYVLPGRDLALGLRLDQVASSAETLKLTLYWWVPGMMIALGYFYFLYSRMFRKPKSPQPVH